MVVLGSGSSGNCTLVEGCGGRVLIDCGLSAREAARRLQSVGCSPRSVDAVIVSHEHADHVGGAPGFSRRFGAPILTTPATAAAAGIEGAGVAALVPIEAGVGFTVADMKVTPFSVPHDAVDNIGLVVECDGTRLGYATDLGHATALVKGRLRECDVIVAEANHDTTMLMNGPYPWSVKHRIMSRHGHLSNDAMEALVSEVATARTRHLVLAHMSRTNNRAELARAACRRGLETAQVSRAEISLAGQDQVCEVIQG